MVKSANLYARIEPELKNEAEAILSVSAFPCRTPSTSSIGRS